MSDNEDWFPGMAAAALTLAVQILNGLIERGVFTPEEARDLIDRGALELEHRDGANPALRPLHAQARSHLERVAAGVWQARDPRRG